MTTLAWPALAAPARAAELVKVRVGMTNSQSDAPFFIGIEKGLFRDQGLSIDLYPFDTAAKMVAPLATGQLDIGGGNGSPALYNALFRGIDIKIVANKASLPPGYGYSGLVVRKDLFDSGKVRSVRDLRGMKIGEPAPSSNILAYALQTGGMTFKDVQPIVLGFPEQFAALQSGALDAMNTVEPFMTRAVQAGVGVKILGYDKVSPNMTVASILYGGPFMKNEPDVARTFMVAYLQAVRYYNDALQNGHLAGRNADDVITILGKYLPLKDPAVYRAITPNGVDPNGHVNVASLQRDLRFYRSEGLIEGDLVADQIVDHRYVDAALKILGPYRPAR